MTAGDIRKRLSKGYMEEGTNGLKIYREDLLYSDLKWALEEIARLQGEIDLRGPDARSDD